MSDLRVEKVSWTAPVPKTKDVSLGVADAGKSPGFPGLLLLPGLENALLNRRERVLVGGLVGGLDQNFRLGSRRFSGRLWKPYISGVCPSNAFAAASDGDRKRGLERGDGWAKIAAIKPAFRCTTNV